jgi:hypothetical protein
MIDNLPHVTRFSTHTDDHELPVLLEAIWYSWLLSKVGSIDCAKVASDNMIANVSQNPAWACVCYLKIHVR